MATKASKNVEKLLDEAFDIAIAEVERLARKVLERPTYVEFVMAMGTWVFVDKNGNHVDDASCMKELTDFIDEWNDSLKLTGWPMRFKKDEQVNHDW